MDLIMNNIPRLLTAFSETLACLVLILSIRKPRRYLLPRILIFGIGQVILQLSVESWSIAFWILGMMINILWMYLTIFFCVQSNYSVVFYSTMKAFIFAEFSASFSWLISLYLFYGRNDNISTLIIICTLILTTLLGVAYYFINSKNRESNESIPRKSLLTTLLTCVIIFLISNLGFLLSSTNYPLGDTSAVFIFRTMIDSLGLAIIYIQESQRKQAYLRDEITAINTAMYYQHMQYINYRENNQRIDQKVHDLKHQLQLINMENDDSPIRKKAMSDIEDLIKKYDATINSGNPVLDTVLTQKNLLCLQNDISFSCMAEGTAIDFMEALDIYSILGNALDNAYESVSKLEGNRRVINLRIFTKDDFTIISVENPYDGELNYIDGIPQTTKKDTQYHGFGIKSMSYIVNKYNGHLTYTTNDSWFRLKIIFSRNDLN